ncbi:uncharacterized protein BT62DRAFT_986039 [Guyanagaster necrorhizus]|uniref:RRN6 beta-propeller domain-containing protein n=1 Tax=Guyanagaster necrorhizus TaxID=856835 RepID=A0A9P7VWU8_9AGAR|nr:uncharacterized protein BT62DRAFT_986039 [Guyanagaster necrorhizus MCA 3950]KAG7447915.1 hypothetical protein BT62DRAFT_986039 [Guyanagaster necrorhizus MCA 3950]
MESWPTDDRKSEDIPRKEGKGKKKEIFQYPNLDHGLVEALTLVEKGNGLEWSSLVKSYGTLYSISEPVKVFPATRPPSITLPHMTLRRRAERGANFLRTHFPEVEIAAELIREEIETDAKVLRDQDVYNPYDGNLLETVISYDSLRPTSSHLAFPMGELGRDLNISPFLPSDNGSVFTPTATPVRSFDTPISQIASPRYDLSNLTQGALLAVRTYGITSVLEMCSGDTPKKVKVVDVATIASSDVGGHQMIDVKFPSVHDLLAVSDHGMVFSYNFTGCKPFPIFDYSTLSSMSEIMSDDFWRLALGANVGTCLLTSVKVLRRLDSRDNHVYSSIFSVTSEKDVITAVEDQDGHLIRLCTTSQLLWIDDRKPGKPLLGYHHNRSFDRTLKTETVSFQSAPLTFLTSRKNGLVDVYNVSRSSENGLVHANALPYCLTSATGFEDSLTGQSFVHHPYLNGDQSFSLLRLSRRGAIQMIELHCSNEIGTLTPQFEWSDDVKDLDLKASTLRPDEGLLGNREHMEVDFSGVYRHVFVERPRLDEEHEEKHAEDVYGLVNRLPLFWQYTNAPIEHMLTTYDIIFRAGDDPDGASRADFLTGSIINSTRGYRALQEGRLSPATLSKGSAWHHNIGPTLHALDSTVRHNVEDILEDLRKYDVAHCPDGTAQSLRREGKAREQLALDLLLSQDVFSVQPLKPPASVPDDLESMTEALSIGNKPPPVDFRYLQPMLRRTAEAMREGGDDDPEMSYPLGVRLLLKEWDAGTDPDNYVYVDPYGGSQELMTSTQILPGPHGGRPPPAGKKKPAKKRLGHASETGLTASPVSPPYGWKKACISSTSNLPYDSAAYNDFLRRNKAVVCALSASYISTFAGYPLDSLKSRLQTTKTPISVSRLAAVVYRDEGVVGFYRGLWIPLITISFVRAASFTIYTRTKEFCRDHNYLSRNSIIDASVVGGISGAMSGALISFGSAPFELVKVRRQLEFAIAASKGIQLTKAPKTWEAVKEIFRSNGITGLYTGFRMHFVRDTTGTALYFLEYDGMRHLLGRDRSGDQGPTPTWLPIPASIVPFFCGSLSGVSSWALIYPLDVVKTKIQQRSLAGERYRGPWETLYRLIRGPDPNNPKPLLAGITRIYRGLGVSAVRSITTHGLLWTFFDLVSNYIDHLP